MALAWPSLWELLLVSFRAPACRWSVLGLYTHHAHSRCDRITPTLPPSRTKPPTLVLMAPASLSPIHLVPPHRLVIPFISLGRLSGPHAPPPEWENSACFFVISSLLHLRSLLAGNCSGSRCSSCSGTGSLPVAAAY